MEGFRIQNINVEQLDNHDKHRTEGFSSSKVLVVRRGAAFRVSLQLTGRPLDTDTDSVMIRILLGRLYVTIPVTTSEKAPSGQWRAYFNPEDLNSKTPSVFICSPASAPVGSYKFKLRVITQSGKKVYACGTFILLCNPWCPEDAVYIPFEDQREEYVLNDSGLLFMGTEKNLVSRPWSFDLYEPGVLEACLNLLQVSPQHIRSKRGDYLKRNNPVYITRVVSAMINSEDDRGVLKGNWTGDYKEGVHPSMWTGSGDILTQWAQSHFRPVKYGQCWVFAAVMCTVLRVLGIPCRVVTNFNSAHDTNGNLVIEEYYSETGKKLSLSKDTIWNFHVWVECWMNRRDLGSGMDGWQVSDPTPQERSRGVFCCGPASVKAIRDQRIDLRFDIPFVYAEVNADVHSVIVKDGQMISHSKDTERIGCLICTKAVGFPRFQNITGDYKKIRSPNPSISSRSSAGSDDSTLSRGSSKGVLVFLTLDKAPIAGPPISFTVKVINRQPVAKVMKVNLNAQAKEYNNSPSETFWENQGVIQLGPREAKVLHYKILPTQYEDVVGDDLVNLAVVLQDQASREQFLTSEEFNILTPQLTIQIEDEDSVEIHKEQTGSVAFTNVFSHPVSGLLTVAGAGLLRGKVHSRMLELLPGDKVEQRINFIPTMVGARMLQASLTLTHINSTIRGFRMVSVMRA